MVLFVAIGFICVMAGMRVFCAEEQNKVFNKKKLPLKDVKAYNHACGMLIWGFCVVTEIICYLCVNSEGIWANLMPLYIIVEAVVLMQIYFQIEKKSIKNN